MGRDPNQARGQSLAVQRLEERVAELEARVAALEERLPPPVPRMRVA
jgi:uncharacterized protein YceH (UPF0502 family)